MCAIPLDWKEFIEVGIISPFSANLFLHYMLDKWLQIWFVTCFCNFNKVHCAFGLCGLMSEAPVTLMILIKFLFFRSSSGIQPQADWMFSLYPSAVWNRSLQIKCGWASSSWQQNITSTLTFRSLIEAKADSEVSWYSRPSSFTGLQIMTLLSCRGLIVVTVMLCSVHPLQIRGHI